MSGYVGCPILPRFGEGGIPENEPALGGGIVQTRPPFRRERERMGHPGDTLDQVVATWESVISTSERTVDPKDSWVFSCQGARPIPAPKRAPSRSLHE